MKFLKSHTYRNSATGEIKYRAERNIGSVEEILRDTIATGLLIARREFHARDDQDSKTKLAEITKGINQFGHFVFEGNFRIDHAQVASAKAAYLSAVILSDHKDRLELFSAELPLEQYMVTHPEYIFLNKRLKFVGEGEALFYWHKTLRLLYPDQGKKK